MSNLSLLLTAAKVLLKGSKHCGHMVTSCGQKFGSHGTGYVGMYLTPWYEIGFQTRLITLGESVIPDPGRQYFGVPFRKMSRGW